MTPLAVAAIHGQVEAVNLLLREGADVNAKHPDGNTALHAAAFFGRPEVVKVLLEHGADVAARNEEGRTPLEGMKADWETIQFVAAILEVELDEEEVLAGRHVVSETLLQAQAGQEEAVRRTGSP